MQITLICTFLLMMIVCSITISLAYPSIYGEDQDPRQVRDADGYNYRNRRSRRVYYYDDDGDYYGYYPYRYRHAYPCPRPYPFVRREDVDSNKNIQTDTKANKAYRYTPLVRYKSTRTQRKKLFVPNMWG